ncbi:hypothetical protein U1Q18_009676 [Sarracenia purpurea var. burkii]
MTKFIEDEVSQARGGLKPFDSSRLVSLDERIQRLKRLSPIKEKSMYEEKECMVRSLVPLEETVDSITVSNVNEANGNETKYKDEEFESDEEKNEDEVEEDGEKGSESVEDSEAFLESPTQTRS